MGGLFLKPPSKKNFPPQKNPPGGAGSAGNKKAGGGSPPPNLPKFPPKKLEKKKKKIKFPGPKKNLAPFPPQGKCLGKTKWPPPNKVFSYFIQKLAPPQGSPREKKKIIVPPFPCIEEVFCFLNYFQKKKKVI